MNDVPVKSLKKALDMLTILLFEDVAGKGVELSHLARQLNIPVNTAHNLLKTMVTCGYVAQNEKSRYLAGPRCRQIGIVNHFKDDYVAQLLYTQLNRLSSELQEAIVYTVLAAGRRVSIAKSEPEGLLIKVDHSAIESSSIYHMPTGMVLTAYASEAEFKDIIEFYGPVEQHWPDFAPTREKILRQGYIIQPNVPQGIRCFAVPVTYSLGRLLGSLGCYAPEFRCNDEKNTRIINRLLNAAETLSMILR